MSTKTKAVAPTLRTNKYNLEKFKTDVLGWCLILPALAIICFYTIWPMIGAIQLAFSKTKGFTVVEWCGFQNFKDVLRHPNFLQALKNSVSYTIWSLIIGLLVPVVIAAVMLAMHNMKTLPETVGIDLQANGEFAQTISRDMAVYIPLAITGGCLLMMVFSRKVIYPWLISVFTLVLPLLVLLLNFFQ